MLIATWIRSYRSRTKRLSDTTELSPARSPAFAQNTSQKYLKFYSYPFSLSVGAQRRSRRAASRPDAWRRTSTPRLAKSGEPLRSVRTDDAEPKVAEGPSATD
jgi:hypothetical protein